MIEKVEVIEVNKIDQLKDTLDIGLDELQMMIAELLSNPGSRARSSEYEEFIGLLTIEKSELEQNLLRKNQEYEELKKAAVQVIQTLRQSINAINLFLKSNRDEC